MPKFLLLAELEGAARTLRSLIFGVGVHQDNDGTLLSVKDQLTQPSEYSHFFFCFCPRRTNDFR